jgi:hypothetical protein
VDGAVAEPRPGGEAASPPPLPPPCDDDTGAGAATGRGVDANPMTLASMMTTTAVTATQA